MIPLEITPKHAKTIEELELAAFSELQEYLTELPADKGRAEIAMAVLNVATKNRELALDQAKYKTRHEA